MSHRNVMQAYRYLKENPGVWFQSSYFFAKFTLTGNQLFFGLIGLPGIEFRRLNQYNMYEYRYVGDIE